jgi:integrase
MLTGMRRGELCGIKWSEIDLVGSRLTVRRSVWQIRSTWGLKDPNTHQVRTIALDPVAMAKRLPLIPLEWSHGVPLPRSSSSKEVRIIHR